MPGGRDHQQRITPAEWYRLNFKPRTLSSRNTKTTHSQHYQVGSTCPGKMAWTTSTKNDAAVLLPLAVPLPVILLPIASIPPPPPPPGTKRTLNILPVNAPKPEPPQKPTHEPMRPIRPMNRSTLVQRHRARHSLKLEWMPPPKVYPSPASSSRTSSGAHAHHHYTREPQRAAWYR